MRQATTPTNGLPARGAFGAPLNQVLGAEANVRLLRELALDHGRYLTPGELAKRTGLTRAAVYRALERLFAAGVIEYDSSVAQRCRLQHASPVAGALRDLFRAEAQRVVAVMEALGTAVGELSPPPISAWIEGRAATGEDEYGDPIVVGLLDVPEHLDEHVEILQERTVELQRRQDVTIEVVAPAVDVDDVDVVEQPVQDCDKRGPVDAWHRAPEIPGAGTFATWWPIAGLLVLLSSVPIPAGAQQPGAGRRTNTEQIAEGGCPACRIRVEPELLVGVGTEEHGGVSTGFLQRDSRGRFLHRNIYDMSRILVFGSDGNYQTAIGRQGGGPGEFVAVGNFFVGPGDTIHVFDQGNARYSTFTPSFEYVRSVVLPAGNPQSFVALAPGRYVISAGYRTRDRFGMPLHNLTPGGLGTSFGGTDALQGRTRPERWALVRRLVADTDSTFWAVYGAEYRIDLWHDDGHTIRTLERNAPWFVRAPPNTIEGRLNPFVLDAQIDEYRRLWMLVLVRDRQWRQRVEWGREGAPGVRGLQTDTGRDDHIYDSVIEVIDLDRGTVLATTRVDQVLWGFAGAGRAWEFAESEHGTGPIRIWQLILDPSPNQRRNP